MNLRRLIAVCFAASLGLAACGREESAPAAEGAQQVGGVLNLYTARHYDADQQLYDGFERRTGVTVRTIDGNADLLVERMRAEGASSPADVLLMADAGALWRAQEAGLFQPVQSAVLDGAIPENLRDPERRWFGFARRARVLVFSKRTPPDTGRPVSYAELADPRHRGRVCVRSSDNVYNLSTVAALIELWGRERALQWARGVVANMARAPQGGDVDQIRAVAAGQCDLALANSYYWIRLARSAEPADRSAAEATIMTYPEQTPGDARGAGALVNISGGGVARNAPNRANAVAFLEYLASPEAQAILAEANNEFPAAKDAPVPEGLRAYADFRASPLPVAVYGRRQAEAQAVFDEAGWR